MATLMFMFIFSGVLVGAISVPMIIRKIPPNGLYGFRVKKTMENPEIWYSVNAYSGKWLMVVGVVVILAAVFFFFIPGNTIDFYAYEVLAAWVVVFTCALIASIRYLNTF